MLKLKWICSSNRLSLFGTLHRQSVTIGFLHALAFKMEFSSQHNLKIHFIIDAKSTYVSEVIVENRSTTSSHTRCIFIGWTNEKVVTNCLANLKLVLIFIIQMRPVRILFICAPIATLNKPKRKIKSHISCDQAF